MDLRPEAVHQSGELDPRIVETADQLAELLLRGDGKPVLAVAVDPELLHDRLQVEHLVDITRHELADLVDHEHHIVARLAPLNQLRDSRREQPGRDVGLSLVGVSPGVVVGINFGSIARIAALASLNANATTPLRSSHRRPPVTSSKATLNLSSR